MPFMTPLLRARLCISSVSNCPAILKRGLSTHDGPLKPAFNFKFWKENAGDVAANIKIRKANADITKVLSLHDEFRAINKECDELRARRNAVASKTKQKISETERQALIEEGRLVKDKLATSEKKATQVEELLYSEALKIPNETHKAVPVGDESKASNLRLVNNKPTFSFSPKDHLQIGESLGILDLESGSKASGSKFYYMKQQGALLDLALVQWAMQRVTAKGFTPVITPDVVHHSLVEGCGFQPRGTGSQVYWLRDHDLCLVGTAEVSLAAMFAGKILEPRDLPIKMVGFSHCFRAETGGGSYNRGLYRVHQFSKVEMFVICLPEQSEKIHDEIRSIQEELYSELGFHFRVLDMPTEDLGASASRKYDMEAWMPSRNTFGEITSASNCTDYQSRRLNIKCRVAPHENVFVHTLNGTACATSRVMLTILENYQQEDGTVIIPTALRPFMGGVDKIQKAFNKTGM